MNYTKLLLTPLFALLLGTMADAKTYATVNGKAITDKDMEIFRQNIPNFNYAKLSDQEKDAVINELIMRNLMLSAAKSAKLDTSKEYTDVVNMLNRQKEEALIQLWQRKEADKVQIPAITEAQLKKIYQENEGQFVEQEGKARHILVSSEAEAKAIIKELNGVSGKKVLETFGKLANTKSIDAGTKQAQNGGDLGTFQRNMMHPDFAKAAFDLKPGNYTKEPVQTPFGYHVIYLDSKTDAKVIPYDKAKKMIEDNIKMQNIQGAIIQKLQAMREKAKISITK